MAQKNK